MARKKRFIASIVIALLGIAILLVFVMKARDPLRWRSRRAWKNEAVEKINQRLADPAWMRDATGRGDGRSTTSPWKIRWNQDEILTMQNGDWIVCQSICSKQDWRIKDLFIGRGSDGNWYYSTFHFCIGRTVLGMDPQPESLAQFANAYWLAKFDGRSDDCLKVTWTGAEPWGLDKIALDASKSEEPR